MPKHSQQNTANSEHLTIPALLAGIEEVSQQAKELAQKRAQKRASIEADPLQEEVKEEKTRQKRKRPDDKEAGIPTVSVDLTAYQKQKRTKIHKASDMKGLEQATADISAIPHNDQSAYNVRPRPGKLPVVKVDLADILKKDESAAKEPQKKRTKKEAIGGHDISAIPHNQSVHDLQPRKKTPVVKITLTQADLEGPGNSTSEASSSQLAQKEQMSANQL